MLLLPAASFRTASLQKSQEVFSGSTFLGIPAASWKTAYQRILDESPRSYIISEQLKTFQEILGNLLECVLRLQ